MLLKTKGGRSPAWVVRAAVLIAFVCITAIAWLQGVVLRQGDLVDLSVGASVLIPDESTDPLPALLRGECTPENSGCGTWVPLHSLRFTDYTKSASRVFLVSDVDFTPWRAAGQSFVVNFDEAYGDFSGWIDGHPLGMTSRNIEPRRKLLPFAGTEALPIPEALIPDGGRGRLLVEARVFSDFPQTKLWRATTFSLLRFEDHIFIAFLSVILVGCGVIAVGILSLYHFAVWLRRRDGVSIGFVAFATAVSVQNFFYFNLAAYFGLSSEIVYLFRFVAGYTSPIVYPAFCLIFGVPISFVWNSIMKQRKSGRQRRTLGELPWAMRLIVVPAELWGYCGIPLFMLTSMSLSNVDAAWLIYSVGLPLNAILVIVQFVAMFRWLSKRATVDNLAYAIPFATGLSVLVGAAFLANLIPLGVRYFPTTSLCTGGVIASILCAFSVGNLYTRQQQITTKNRELLERVIAAAREIIVQLNYRDIVASVQRAFASLISMRVWQVDVLLSAECFAGQVLEPGFYQILHSGEPLRSSRRRSEEVNSPAVLAAATNPHGGEVLAMIVQRSQWENDDDTDALFRVLGNSVASAITTVRFEQTFQALERRTQEVRTIFKHINQGILVFDENRKIAPDYSGCLEKLLGVTALQGRDVLPVLFDRSDLSKEDLARIGCTLQSILGEQLFVFDVNRSNLPSKIEHHRDGGDAKFEIDWIAIPDDAGTVRRCMVVIRDVTELLRIHESSARDRTHLTIMGELVSLRPDEFDTFREFAQIVLTRSMNYANGGHQAVSQDGVLDIRRDFHTLKGNGRTLGLSLLTDKFHEIESIFKEEASPDTRGANLLNEALATVSKTLQEYSQFHEQISLRTQSIDSGIGGLCQEMNSIFDHCQRQSALDAVTPWLQQLRARVLEMEFPTLSRLVDDISRGIRSLAQDLGKRTPVVDLDNQVVWILTREAADALAVALTHVMRNTLDHGFSVEQEGRIRMVCSEGEDCLELLYESNESGLDLVRLEHKAKGLGMQWTRDDELVDLIFSPEFSTAEKVSEISGRGLGMTAVRHALETIGGSVEIVLTTSIPLNGRRPFRFRFSLPTHRVVLAYQKRFPSSDHETSVLWG